MRFKQGEIPIRQKTNNQSMILQMIYHYGPIKRPDIADILGLTRPTITTAVKTMIEKGIVAEITDLPDTEEVSPGRKAYPVDIVADCKYFIGVEMRSIYRTACITDYLGNVVYRELDTQRCQEYDQNIAGVCRMITRAMENGPVPRSRIAGIGVCVPGLVDKEKGILQVHPAHNWRDKNMRADVLSGIPYDGPVSLSNNACARTRSVQMFQKEPISGQSFAYLFISTGIACPLMLNSFNSYGSVVGLGEVGHTVMDPNGPLCRCGNHGCLEAFSSDRALISRCREALSRGEASVLRELCGATPVTMEQILKAQAAGDQTVCAIIRKAVEILGLGVTNICNFACPGTLFIEGLLFERRENQELLLDVIHRNLYSATHAHTDIVFLQPDIYSGAIGAAAVAVKADLENYPEKRSRDSF